MRCLAMLSLLVLFAGSAGAISITDYEVPVSTATSAFGGFQYNYASDVNGIKTADNGNISASLNQFYSSLPLGYRLGFSGILNRDGLVDPGQDEWTYNSSAFAQGDKYLSEESNVFGLGRLDGTAGSDYDRPGFTLTLGMGYGRFINATPLARALRAQEELLKEGILLSQIPDNVMLDVAKMMAPEVIAKYQQEFDQWERHYYGDLEKEFQRSGKLRDNELGGVGALVIRDVLSEFISDRYYGYELSGGVGYDLQTPYKHVDRTAFAEANANFAYPISLRSQFVEFLRVKSPLTDNKFGKEVHLSFTPSYSYELSNTLDFVTTYILTGDKLAHSDAGWMFNHQVKVTLSYYIVNRVTFSNALTLSKPDGAKKTATAFSSGLTYRFR
ncbi:MAG TPA: hypothetical protein VMU02_12115 [bacterium]|nr:hypothetical protein [bacterium]